MRKYRPTLLWKGLLLIGILFYKEVITLRQLAGVLLCMASMFLLAK